MILSKTPFRISFAGGGSDLPDFYRRRAGAVVSTTIDKAMYLAIHPYFHDKIRIKYSRTEDVMKVSDIEHPLVRECLRVVGLGSGMEIASFADVPAGTGMGSSSAFTVGLLHALEGLAGKKPSPQELAAAACDIEITRVKEPIGKQDQYASAFGGLNLIRFHPDERVEVLPIACSVATRAALEQRLMLFYIGRERPASTILAEQSRNMSDNEKFTRVAKMVELAEDLGSALEKNNLDSFGEILHEGWLLKSIAGAGHHKRSNQFVLPTRPRSRRPRRKASRRGRRRISAHLRAPGKKARRARRSARTPRDACWDDPRRLANHLQ